MIVQNTYTYIHIGLCLRYLRNVPASSSSGACKSTLETLKVKLKKGNFDVSLASMTSTVFGAMEESLLAVENEKPIQQTLATEIEKQIRTLESVVFAESVTKSVYILPNRRFNTDYLLSQPHKLLKDGAFDKLEEIAKTDFSSSCRCILFGEATAAAFHILRATESVLKSYYFHHRKQERLKKPMWGPMLDQLRSKTRNKPPAALLSSLDLIRSAYRNPTQHPEAIYEIDSAQDLFGVCIDAISKMTEEL